MSKDKEQNVPTPSGPEERRMLTRRKVIKLGALISVALPLIITLTPTEARADETEGS